MPAVAGEQLVAGLQAARQVHAPHAAQAAVQHAAFLAHGAHGHAKAVVQPPGHQAHHARVPARAAHEQHAVLHKVVRLGLRGGLRGGLGLQLLAPGVGGVQGLRQRVGLGPVAGEQQAHAQVGVGHAARGVQARGQLVGKRVGGKGQGAARRVHQRAQAGPLRDARQPQRHQGAILVQQGHDIGHGGQRRKVQPALGRIFAQQRHGHLQRRARAAQAREGVAVQHGVHHRVGGAGQ